MHLAIQALSLASLQAKETNISNKRNIKVMNDLRSKFSNLSSWKEKPEKNQGFNGIRTHDLRDTGAMHR